MDTIKNGMYQKATLIVARWSYLIFVIMLLGSPLLLAAPGHYTPYFALMGAIGVFPALSDSRRLRVWCIPAVVIAMLLIYKDYSEGIVYWKHFQDIREKAIERKIAERLEAEAPTGPDKSTAKSSEKALAKPDRPADKP